jgi:hypothetical protein
MSAQVPPFRAFLVLDSLGLGASLWSLTLRGSGLECCPVSGMLAASLAILQCGLGLVLCAVMLRRLREYGSPG